MLGLTDRGQPPPSIANTCTYTHTLDSIGSSKIQEVLDCGLLDSFQTLRAKNVLVVFILEFALFKTKTFGVLLKTEVGHWG